MTKWGINNWMHTKSRLSFSDDSAEEWEQPEWDPLHPMLKVIRPEWNPAEAEEEVLKENNRKNTIGGKTPSEAWDEQFTFHWISVECREVS